MEVMETYTPPVRHMLPMYMTVRHLFRSKQLRKILNRLAPSKTKDFCLDMETALAMALDEVSTYMTPQIAIGEGSVVFHWKWDNLSKIAKNVHGSNIVISAGGIMVQEVKHGTQRPNVQ